MATNVFARYVVVPDGLPGVDMGVVKPAYRGGPEARSAQVLGRIASLDSIVASISEPPLTEEADAVPHPMPPPVLVAAVWRGWTGSTSGPVDAPAIAAAVQAAGYRFVS